MQQNSDSKHTANTTKDYVRYVTYVLGWPSQSPDLYSTEHAFNLLKKRLKGEPPKTNN